MKLGFKVWLLIFSLVLSFLFIFGLPPKFLESGVVITSIGQNSTLFDQGLKQGQVIISIDGQKISDFNDYSNAISGKFISGNETKLIVGTNKGEYTYYGDLFPELIVGEIPKTNLKLGLDLAGGSRALIKAENKSLDQGELSDLVSITQNRLNAFGLTDLKVSPVSDLSGNNFMLIEIAGATPKDLKELISKQGKFEAKIGNVTVFEGGSRDIASVGRDAQSARIEGCNQGEGGYICRFNFEIVLSAAAAEKHAEITKNIPINSTSQGNYLAERLDLILDDNLVDSLLISEGLKGRATTQIAISGSGSGKTQEEALSEAKAQMKKLQTILMTGSLPYKLEIVKLDTISPMLGEGFVKYILFAGIVAILSISIIIFIRYQRWKISLAVILTTVSEVVIILGISAFIKWNLDFPSIAGILATIGTGVDDLVILIDETSTGLSLSIKQKLKRAFAIILGAYFASLVSLLPLMWAGAGLLKGFAITTIIGISVGVFITRPAFGELLKRFKKE
ncbi:hypothetical protein AUJ61_03405 [Candidatus Pacearchaeota archaeon CG1_02_30_18]|nr:hypothetical protein [Candidatus Pacearchaeota archaeon]OIO39802.1 MAG: hypothetical protein AUJ61_03405 [Candidatus Pacearchaeota archaeon CG1_02_30_18]PIN71136.1 MAG: hypothetical protein COV77_03525 [Candidatus Pacearchaeota archaeon CG11_big_fil_rev_8_21_14_0_20_30_13]PIZ82106.1 MAG: hypothetical protein COX98_01095 [Candidatus Pacearchaeota archaeon CG_4_10_14_0_2_um_filter_30_11]PJA71506.1 MAG: hypothetical protein CO153_01040 [Candidatus Pacearchaeota archaeon CG_4_9_14_3_um_filter_30